MFYCHLGFLLFFPQALEYFPQKSFRSATVFKTNIFFFFLLTYCYCLILYPFLRQASITILHTFIFHWNCHHYMEFRLFLLRRCFIWYVNQAFFVHFEKIPFQFPNSQVLTEKFQGLPIFIKKPSRFSDFHIHSGKVISILKKRSKTNSIY